MTIENFHYETKEIPPDQSFEKEFKNKTKKLEEEIAEIDKKIAELKTQYFKGKKIAEL